MNLIECIRQGSERLEQAQLHFGHGVSTAYDEACWLILWQLGLPLDSDLDDPQGLAQRPINATEQAHIEDLLAQRIHTRKPAAYLTREAWLQGVPFYIDERSIVPRSLIAELIADASFDAWLGEHTCKVLDLCTGNGSLAVLCALAWPEVQVHGADISTQALEVARINVEKHQLTQRIQLLHSDGLSQVQGPYDLMVCNPPYVNAHSMDNLPGEYRAEPALALAGGVDGMDFIRVLLQQAADHLSPQGVMVLEIGHERAHFEAAFPHLNVVWLPTRTTEDQVLLFTREDLLSQPECR